MIPRKSSIPGSPVALLEPKEIVTLLSRDAFATARGLSSIRVTGEVLTSESHLQRSGGVLFDLRQALDCRQ